MTELATDIDAFYQPLPDGSFLPTIYAQGAWRADEQHMGPITGLIVAAFERHDPRPDMQFGRFSFDILGQMDTAPTFVEVRTERPGRTIELLVAELSIHGRVCVRAHAWRGSIQDSSPVAGVQLAPIPGPDEVDEWLGGTGVWGGGYIGDLEFRSTDREPGHSVTWIRSPRQLINGQETGPYANFCRLVDTSNGIAVRADPHEWMFPNVDLTIHLFREPVPGWIGFDVRVSMGATGMGLTSSTLHDVNGPVGRAEQFLTVRPMPH